MGGAVRGLAIGGDPPGPLLAVYDVTDRHRQTLMIAEAASAEERL